MLFVLHRTKSKINIPKQTFKRDVIQKVSKNIIWSVMRYSRDLDAKQVWYSNGQKLLDRQNQLIKTRIE